MSSFFGKKTKEEPVVVTGVVTTGGKIDEIVSALIDAANDQDPRVRQSMQKSLQEIGKKQPNLVLSCINDYITKNFAKILREHRILLLNVIYQVLELQRSEVSPGVMLGLISLGINEMTAEKQEVIPDWQTAASSVLVSVAMRFPNEILDELMKRFTPGSVPHYFIMKTLGDVVFANALETVPRLKEIIARVLPVLGSIKQENIKWVFASGLGKFCDAIITYVANSNNSQYTIYSFSSDIYPAYEILFTTWLQSKEPRVRLTTIQALGSMCAVLERDQLEAQLPRLVPTLLAFYKKEKEILQITQGFTNILEVAMKGGSRCLDPLLPQIFATMHPLACMIPDYTNSLAIKNYNELLRCFQTITTVFSDSVITYLLERINNKDIKIKIGTIAIIRHLITHNVEHLDDKRGLLVSGIKPLCATETSWTVKKELSQIIIAMASYGYWQLEGGESLVEFIIRNCSISDNVINEYEKDKKKDPTQTSPGELRTLCDNILNLATTTIEPIHSVLWPYLLETVVNGTYSPALGIICKSISHIASLKRENEAEDYIIDFDRAPNVPKPQAIIARLLVMVNAPTRRNQLGLNILQTLKAIGPVLHPSICDMWDNAIPKLIAYLEANSSSWNQNVWEELTLRLLSETIKIANDDEWTNQLGENITKQFELYENDPDMKRVAFKHLGLILQKSSHKESIRNRLETMLYIVNSANEAERLGCAQGFGYCGATHLDMTLEKLQNAGKGGVPAAPKKPSGGGFLSFLSKEKTDGGDLTTTLILAYGYIAAYAQPSLITSRIDISIINHLKPTMVKPKSTTVRECLITTIDLIGKAMHTNHLKKEYVFKQRDDLLKQLLVYLTAPANEINNQIRTLGLNACATLINLDPILPEDLENLVLEKLVPYFSLTGIEQTIMQQVLDALNTVFTSILLSQPTIECLCRLFKFIEPVVCSKDATQRERACSSVVFLLKKVADLKTKETSQHREKIFAYVGHCIAMLIPRCTDPVVAIRQLALEGIQLCLYIDFILRQGPSQEAIPIPQELVPFKSFRDRISTDELNEQFSIIHEMSRVLSIVITKEELPELLLSSLKGLNDSQLSSTSGTCVVLNGLIKARGVELLPKVPQIVSGLLSALEGISNDQTMNGTLHALRSLATHHEIPVVDELLKAPVPHSTFVCKALQAIAKDENLVMALIQHLFEIINNSQLYEEKATTDPKVKKPVYVACHVPLSATCAIGELLQLEELEDVVSENYPLFLGSLLLRIGTSYGMTDKLASDQIAAALKHFLTCAKEVLIEGVMTKKNSWELLNTQDYHRAVTDIAGAVCKAHPNEMEGIYNFLYPFLKGNFVGQRIVAATVLAEFINNCQNKSLLSKLVTCILGSLRDPTVKLQSLIGLGNIVAVGTEEANQYAPTVLDALMSSIDDANEIIALEAMNGLKKVFKVIEESRISPILVNVCHRIKPAFDKDNHDVRTAAFNLFGALHRFGTGSSADAFYEQIHDNLPSIILHLNDENSNVQAACKNALRDLAPLFRAKEVQEMFTSSTLDPNRSLDYIEFLNELSILLINSYPQRINYYVMTCVEYFKSNWNVIKSNAVNFVGFLLGNMSIEKRKGTNLNPGLITRAMVLLLKERAPEVRKSAADSMSLLHNY